MEPGYAEIFYIKRPGVSTPITDMSAGRKAMIHLLELRNLS